MCAQVKCLALAGKPKEAVELALATLQQQLGEAHCDYDEVLRLNEVGQLPWQSIDEECVATLVLHCSLLHCSVAL